MAHTFVDDDAETHKETQYFETIGQRGIWHKGWKAVTFHRGRTDYDSDPWELYNLDQDIAELNDLSSEYPQRLDELISLWWQEAERYGVLALDDLAGYVLFGDGSLPRILCELLEAQAYS